MVTKLKSPVPPPVPSDPTEASSPAESESTSSQAETQSPPSEPPASTPPAAPPGTETSTATTGEEPAVEAISERSAESMVVIGDERERIIRDIMEMGYDRAQVERAMAASFYNPHTAVQYLIEGIPPNFEVRSSLPPQVAASEEQSGGEGVEGSETSDESDPLAFLLSNPQFAQMRQMIRSNPQLLDAFIQQIGQSNPELLQLIQQNQEAFVRMINEDPSPASGGTPQQGGGRSTGGQATIQLSPQDRDAIDRLVALGNFPEDVVIQAYFACEKNENLAAEFLFSQSWD